jgi:hypothetical protein
MAAAEVGDEQRGDDPTVTFRTQGRGVLGVVEDHGFGDGAVFQACGGAGAVRQLEGSPLPSDLFDFEDHASDAVGVGRTAWAAIKRAEALPGWWTLTGPIGRPDPGPAPP